MTDREKLIQIIDSSRTYVADKENLADHLLANGVTFTPSIPGPSESDPNIMELCFHNGERHMKEKVLTKLKDISAEILFEERIFGEMKVVTFEQVIQILEDL